MRKSLHNIQCLNTFFHFSDIFFRTLSRTFARSNLRHFKQIIVERTIVEQIIDLSVRRSDDTYNIIVHLFLNHPTRVRFGRPKGRRYTVGLKSVRFDLVRSISCE